RHNSEIRQCSPRIPASPSRPGSRPTCAWIHLEKTYHRTRCSLLAWRDSLKVEKILISACLLGERVRYHGGDARIEHPSLHAWAAEGRLVLVCPEVEGGLTTPRPAAEITTTPNGRRVLTATGRDVTDAFDRGAEAALAA